jgi:hypothetical protein
LLKKSCFAKDGDGDNYDGVDDDDDDDSDDDESDVRLSIIRSTYYKLYIRKNRAYCNNMKIIALEKCISCQ